MLKKLILIAAGILVAKAVVEVAAEENEKVSSVVETTKSYVRKVVNKVAKTTTNTVKEAREFVKSILDDHPNTYNALKFGVSSGAGVGGILTGVVLIVNAVTKYLPKL